MLPYVSLIGFMRIPAAFVIQGPGISGLLTSEFHSCKKDTVR